MLKSVLVLIFTLSTPVFAAKSIVQSDPLACVKGFLAKFDPIQEYRTTLYKKNFDSDGQPSDKEKIDLFIRKPDYVRYIYLNEGSTGIKNNGMTIVYSGQPRIKVKVGSSKGLGFLASAAASVAISDPMYITDSKVVDGEILTINRAGFEFISELLKKNLNRLTGLRTEMGGISFANQGCTVTYKRHTSEYTVRRLQPEDSIFKIEEQDSLLAYHLFLENQPQFSKFSDLFHRKQPVDLKIPKYFMDFKFEIDPTTSMPVSVELFSKNQKVAEFKFTDVQYLK